MIEHVTQDYLKHVYVVNPSGGGGASSVNLIGTDAARPAAGTAGRIYYTTNAPILFRDNGVTWDSFGPIWKFTDPNLRTWHDYSLTGTTVTVSNGHRVMRCVNSASGIRGQYTNVTAPFVATFAMLAGWTGAGAGFGIMATDGTKSEFSFINNLNINILRFTNPTTFDSTVTSNQLYEPQGTIWLRISDDTINRTYWISPNGNDWISIGGAGSAVFLTATAVGFFAGPNTSGSQDLVLDLLSVEIA